MDNFFIFDNFLEEKELNKLKKFIKTSFWKFGHGNKGIESIDTKYFASYKINNFISDYVRNKIEKLIPKKLKITRNYLQVQEFGENGGYHIDTTEPNTYTFTLYITELNDKNVEEANGEFLLKIPNEPHIISVDTYCNRGVFFPSTCIHKGMAYNRLYSQKRVCVAWKFEEIIENI